MIIFAFLAGHSSAMTTQSAIEIQSDADNGTISEVICTPHVPKILVDFTNELIDKKVIANHDKAGQLLKDFLGDCNSLEIQD